MTVLEGKLTGLDEGIYNHWELHCAHYFKDASFVDSIDRMIFEVAAAKPVGAPIQNAEGVVFAHALLRALTHVQPGAEMQAEIEEELRDTDPDAAYHAIRRTERGTHVGTIVDGSVRLSWYPPNLQVHLHQ